MVTEVDRELPNIIARAQAGDVGAFGDLYSRYAGLILRYLYGRLREPESAQDMTQEVFLRVLKGIGGFEYRGEKSFLGWLYTIAGNVLIGQARRKNPISTPLDEGLEIADPHGMDAVQSVFDRVTLRQAISKLTDDQQQVLVLKFFADMTNGEIAQTIGRTEGAVKALQHRALAALQNILTETTEVRALEYGGKSELTSVARRNGASVHPLSDDVAGEVSVEVAKRSKRERGPYKGP